MVKRKGNCYLLSRKVSCRSGRNPQQTQDLKPVRLFIYYYRVRAKLNERDYCILLPTQKQINFHNYIT